MSSSAFELVSVVIPTRNRLPLLKGAIASVRSQSWPNVEIIIVDDDSTDATASFIQNEALIDQRIRYLHNDRAMGGAASRNAGMALARGAYVAFLDDDDLWMPEKIERQISLLKSNIKASAVSCSFSEEYPSGNKKLRLVRATVSDQEVLKSNKLGGASMCFASKSILDEVGGFDPLLRSGQDWDLWIRLNRKGPILVCTAPFVRHLFHDGERITTNPKAAYLGRRRIYFKYKEQFLPATRLHQLRDLAYFRLIVLANSTKRRWRGLFRIFEMTSTYYGLRCLNRLFRLELASKRWSRKFG